MSEDAKAAGFDSWAIVEVMGHKKFAGRVQEHVVAGHGFIRVDVPECEADGQKVEGFTKFIGPSSVYAMTPVSEAVARAVALQLRERPVHPWEMPRTGLPSPDGAIRKADSVGRNPWDEDADEDDEDDWVPS